MNYLKDIMISTQRHRPGRNNENNLPERHNDFNPMATPWAKNNKQANAA